MALNPVALSAAIKSLLLASPIGQAPVSTVMTKVTKPDGTCEVKSVPVMGPVMLDATLAGVIANAVANGVCAHILLCAQVVGVGGGVPGPMTGKVL
jgi:hypothetical protein